KAAALVDLSTVAGNKISNPPWVKFQSAGWVNFPSAPTCSHQYGNHKDYAKFISRPSYEQGGGRSTHDGRDDHDHQVFYVAHVASKVTPSRVM
ncbi:hypothetical protein, partial [Pseudomonas aeruginosa]|uniref:hypothetical protein n=1 Tax=Pseudomonas aeruginosa TaxID=287 RepID=UPI0039833425